MKMNLEKIMTLWHPYAKTFFLHSVFTHFAVAQYRMHLGRDNKSKLFLFSALGFHTFCCCTI